MQLTRLSWAGLMLEHGGRRIVIDPIGRSEHLRGLMGHPSGPVLSLAGLEADAALVTHRHPDHFDPPSLRQVLAEGGVVYCPPELRQEAERAGLNPSGVKPGVTVMAGCFTVTGVEAVDGFGDPQVSWAVEAGGARVFHGGDTLWHGHWWTTVRDCGPFDAALLPINGVRMKIPGLVPSGLPAAMTPEQAAAAASLLQAETAIPMHYGLFDDPDRYAEWPDAQATFLSKAEERGQEVHLLGPGETWEP